MWQPVGRTRCSAISIDYGPQRASVAKAFKPRVTKCSLESDSSFCGKSKYLLCRLSVMLVLQSCLRYHIMGPHTQHDTLWQVVDRTCTNNKVSGSVLVEINKNLWTCWYVMIAVRLGCWNSGRVTLKYCIDFSLECNSH